MKICRKCRKQIHDQVRFCPNCGTKVVDDREDLKAAMNEVFEKKKKKDVLTKIIIFLIVLIILVSIVGGILIGKALQGNNVTPNNPPITDELDDNNDQNNDVNNDQNNDVNNDQNTNQDDQNDVVNNDGNDNQEDQTNDGQDEIVDDENNDEIIDDNQDPTLNFVSNGKIDFVFIEENIFNVTEFLVSKDEDGVRFDIKMKVNRPGNLYLMDNHSLSIGPIQLNKGERSSYFIVNGQADYTLAFSTEYFDYFEYDITHDMIEKALQGVE